MKISNALLLLVALLLVSSCSDVALVESEYDEGVTKKDNDLYWVYCTEKDRANGKKSFETADENLCLKKQIVTSGYKIYFKSTILNYNAEGDDEIGFNELLISKDGKIIKRVKLESLGHPFYFTTGFVKIRNGVYLKDLNDDGVIEFAVVRYGTDRNRFTKALIYSLKANGELSLYGRGTFNKDQGGHVMFGCPKCHTINMDGCKSCY